MISALLVPSAKPKGAMLLAKTAAFSASSQIASLSYRISKLGLLKRE